MPELPPAAPPPTVFRPVRCMAAPTTVQAGETVSVVARNLRQDVAYTWTTTGGTITSSSGSGAVVDTSGLAPGGYLATIGHVADGGTRIADCTSAFAVSEPPRARQAEPPPAPVARDDTAEQLAQLRAQLNAIQKTADSGRGLRLTLNSVLFSTGRYNLSPNAESILERVSAILRQYRNLEIHVEGYTDSVGSAATNQRLSESRARTVKDYLVRSGLPEASITAAGYGKDFPVASNATAAGRSQNRRVDIILAGGGIGVRYREP
jgi:outer membrane protein OmpA-like peptidoglycan-associated protein